MDDLTRLFDPCRCFDCSLPDPAPDIDDDLPGEVRYGSPAWMAMISALDDDLDDCISEDDILTGDAPMWEDIDWWLETTRDLPGAAELMLAEAQVRADHDRMNGYGDPEYRTWAADFDRHQFEAGMDREQPGDDGPEYDEDVEMRGHRAGTEF